MKAMSAFGPKRTSLTQPDTVPPLPSLRVEMRRRDFIKVIGGAVATWPVMARAQQTPVIGFLNGQSPDNYSHLAAAFRRGLREAGFVDGQNAIIEYRWANGQDERLPMLAAELIERKVTVLVSSGGVSASIAAQKATKTVPIVFLSGSDPVRYGFVTSISHPGGNATGVSFLVNQLNAKRLELAAQLVPNSRMACSGRAIRPAPLICKKSK